MKIAIQPIGPDSGKINSFGGGEARWNINVYDILKQEGYDVHYRPPGEDAGFDLYLDTPWTVCKQLKSKKHVHFSFAAMSGNANLPQARTLECFREGGCILANPYRVGHSRNVALQEGEEDVDFVPVFIPMPFADIYKPNYDIEPSDRKEIVWATKSCFAPHFETRGEKFVFVPNNAAMTLRALVRLNQRVDFKMNFLLSHHLKEAHPRHNVPELFSKFKDANKVETLPWTELLKLMSRSKLNVPVGGLQASVMEGIFGTSLPVLYQDSRYYSGLERDMCLLPSVREATEDDIYNALETFWFDEKAYKKAWEFYQDSINRDHTTSGWMRNFKEALETMDL